MRHASHALAFLSLATVLGASVWLVDAAEVEAVSEAPPAPS